MALPIEELGGLPEGEIDFRILQSKVDMGKMLDEKLGQVTDAMNTRMDGHETHVNLRLNKQDAVMAEMLEVVKRVDAKGDAWAVKDDQWRDKLTKRVENMEELLKLLKLYILATRAFKIAKTSVNYVLHEGKQVGIWIAAIASTWVAVIQFFHTIYPEYIHPFLLHYFTKH